MTVEERAVAWALYWFAIACVWGWIIGTWMERLFHRRISGAIDWVGGIFRQGEAKRRSPPAIPADQVAAFRTVAGAGITSAEAAENMRRAFARPDRH